MNVFKKARQKSRLTLDDVRYLLNLKCWGSLSRLEAGKRQATKEVAIGYHVLFDVPFEAMFKSEIEHFKLFSEGYAESRIEDVQSKSQGIDHVERILSLKEIAEKSSN